MLKKYQKLFFIIGGFLILGAFVLIYLSKTKLEADAISYDNEINIQNEKNVENDKKIVVDVKGAVKKSGVYSLNEGDRIIDAINAAGGISKNGITNNINLSKKLTNEMVVYVFTKSEYSKTNKKECNCEVIKVNECTIENSQNIKSEEKEAFNYDNVPCIVTETPVDNCISINHDSSKININYADVNALTSLSGIGEAKAKSIIEYRNNNGLFKDINDIKNVSGLGESLFEKIKDYITV